MFAILRFLQMLVVINRKLDQLLRKVDQTMSTLKDVTDGLDAVKTGVDGLKAAIVDLKNQVANGHVVSQDELDALAAEVASINADIAS